MYGALLTKLKVKYLRSFLKATVNTLQWWNSITYLKMPTLHSSWRIRNSRGCIVGDKHGWRCDAAWEPPGEP